MDENSIMPFGRFKGRKLKDVPDWYLISLYKNNRRYRTYGRMSQLMVYINDNYDTMQPGSSDPT